MGGELGRCGRDGEGGDGAQAPGPASPRGAPWLGFAAGLAVGLGVGWLLLGPLTEILLLVFAAALFGLILDALARPLHALVPRLPRVLALAAVLLSLAAAAALLGLLAGPAVAEQVRELAERVPRSLEDLRTWVAAMPFGSALIRDLPPGGELLRSSAPLLGRVPAAFSTFAGVLAAVTFVLLAGSFAAIRPDAYVHGLVRLVPPRGRRRAREVLHALAHALRWWLVGRLGSMAAVGVLTALGLSLLGIPLPLALGAIAGLLSFVPFLGPVLAALPALLIAIGQGPMGVLQVVAVYAGVQALEGNLLTPLIQERAVSLPPAALLTAQLTGAIAFGAVGVLLATPLLVMVVVLVQSLYLEQVLGDEDVKVLGGKGPG